MGFLTDLLSFRDKPTNSPVPDTPKAPVENGEAPAPPPSGDQPAEAEGAPLTPSSGDPPSASDEPPVSQANHSEALPEAEQPSAPAGAPASPESGHRWSFQRPFGILRSPKPTLSNIERHDTRARAASKAAAALVQRQPSLSYADRRAQQSALVVRSLIVGQNRNENGLPAPESRVSRAQLSKVKSQLLEPKMANKLIAQLKSLPALPGSASRANTPIHAVCLSYADEEASEKHFSRLRDEEPVTERALRLPTVASATVDSVTEAFKDLHVVSLFTAPDLGLGQPGDGPGLLAGAVPTAETVINGIVQVTPQLMALGYATGKAIIPDHKGLYPPTDRMSVLTYWWGLELLMPSPTLVYLDRAQSISHTVMNFLTALSVVYEGVREIIPFVRYISQYVEFEFKAIKGQDRGKGVVCAATWIMPAAMVPRPWDFPDPPPQPADPSSAPEAVPSTNAPSVAPAPAPPNKTAAPASPSSPALVAPPVSPPSQAPAPNGPNMALGPPGGSASPSISPITLTPASAT